MGGSGEEGRLPAGWRGGGGPEIGTAENTPRFTLGSQNPRGPYLVPLYLYKSRGGPHVCLIFAFRNKSIAMPRAASELHSRDGPDFKGIARPNILRTGI